MTKTQTEQVHDYLKEHGAITALDALAEIGCMRLGARIFDLREQGIAIEREMVSVRTRSGKTAMVAEYRLKREKPKPEPTPAPATAQSKFRNHTPDMFGGRDW